VPAQDVTLVMRRDMTVADFDQEVVFHSDLG